VDRCGSIQPEWYVSGIYLVTVFGRVGGRCGGRSAAYSYELYVGEIVKRCPQQVSWPVHLSRSVPVGGADGLEVGLYVRL